MIERELPKYFVSGIKVIKSKQNLFFGENERLTRSQSVWQITTWTCAQLQKHQLIYALYKNNTEYELHNPPAAEAY